MKTLQSTLVIDTIHSVTGRAIYDILDTANGFGFYHLRTEEYQDGFVTEQDARDAAIDYHTEWQENL